MMIKEWISYFQLFKSKTIIVVFLFIFTPSLNSFDGLLKAGYYYPYEYDFRTLYGSGGLMLGAEISYPILPFVDVFGEIADYHASGKLQPGDFRTSFRLFQSILGPKIYMDYKNFSFYLALAPTFNFFRVKNEVGLLPNRLIRGSPVGYLVRLGTSFFLKELLVDLSFDHIQVPHEVPEDQQASWGFLKELGGFRAYLGLGFRY